MSKAEYSLFEIFNSIEGEFPKSGISSTFVRFPICNYTCSWCDTMQNPKNKPRKFTIEEILVNVKKTNAITFTGGEPSLFIDQICSIIDAIIDAEIYIKFIKIETNGSALEQLTTTLRSKYGKMFGSSYNSTFVISWSPKFYNKTVKDISFSAMYNEYDPTNTYVKVVLDPKIKPVLMKFINGFIEHYGEYGKSKFAIMPLSITVNGVGTTSDPKSLDFLHELSDKKLNVSLRFHEILKVK